MEGDIKACFDEISHPALMDRVRRRVGDKRVLALVKAFLKSGILGEDRAAAGDQRRNPARVDSFAVAQQRGPLGAGRVHRPGTGRPSASRNERVKTSPTGPAELPAVPVRRRLVPDRVRHAEPTRRRCARRSPGSWPRWAYACQRTRR